MLQIEKQEDMGLGLTYINTKDICDDFWSKLISDNSKILN